MHKPVGSGFLLSLVALSLFARGPEVDEVAHLSSAVNQISGLAILAVVVWKNYADTVTLDHSHMKLNITPEVP